MKLPPDFEKELASFPAALRRLVEAELAAGNSVIAIEHGFPAAPCGASVKLAQVVRAERRRSVDGVSFCARNNQSYAGEFTTAERHFFVLEPPLPPEPAPDMDAIRRALEPKPNLLAEIPQRRTGSSVEAFRKESSLPRSPGALEEAPAATRALTSTETATGWTRLLHFRDRRPPHEVQFALERELMVLFNSRMEDGALRMTATADVTGARYDFEVQFVAAHELDNRYALCVTASWAGSSQEHHEYYRGASDSWFQSWTDDFAPADPPSARDNLNELYRGYCEVSLHAERHLNSVAAVQRAVVDGVKQGGTFSTSHKEGGAKIYWRNGEEFVRSDYGDYPDFKVYRDEAEFLQMLWNFCSSDVTRRVPKGELSEFAAWKLILRRMRA